MASIIAKKKANQLYYYVVESARVDWHWAFQMAASCAVVARRYLFRLLPSQSAEEGRPLPLQLIPSPFYCRKPSEI